MNVLCNECGKELFITEKENLGAIGAECQSKGFTYKNACLYSEKYSSLFFCNKECAKSFYGKHIPKNKEVEEILKDFKNNISETSKELAKKLDKLSKVLNKLLREKRNIGGYT